MQKTQEVYLDGLVCIVTVTEDMVFCGEESMSVSLPPSNCSGVLSEELLPHLQQILSVHDDQDLWIIECALGRLDPALMRTYLPAAAAVERRRSRVMNELGVL